MTEQRGAAVQAATAQITVSAGLTGSVAVRGYLAAQHLWSARRAARESAELEDRLAGTKLASVELEAVVTNAVLLSVAFLEAAVNEILQDLAESEPGKLNARCDGLSEDVAALVRELWIRPARLERAGLLEKYQVALTAARKPALDKGANPYQAATKLIDLRNALVHFKPEWQRDDDEHVLQRQLKGLFPESRIFPDPVSPWYPRACLSTGCAAWAHLSATALVDEWWSRMGLTRDYHEGLLGWPAP